MTLSFRCIQPSHSQKASKKRRITAVGWLTVIGIVGTTSVISFSNASNQEAVAQASQRSQFIRSENRFNHSSFLERQKFARSLALLKLGVKTRATHGWASTQAESQPIYQGKRSYRTLGDYVNAASVVFSAIAPQSKLK
jgi:hypothetical protein